MSLYKLGSKGREVEKIQEKLKALDLYIGPIDGIFGGGTLSGVKRFQHIKGLKVDGIVGPETWKALFGEEIPVPSIVKKPLDYRNLAMTGSFETGRPVPDCFAGLSGDFDGQGISFGVLQWNFGQDSLQPLLIDMNNEHPELLKDIFQEKYDILMESLSAGKDELMEFARSIQHPIRHFIFEPWRGMFKTLGRTEEFQNIELRYAKDLYNAALGLCKEYGLTTQRGVALMFDIKVQNGSIRRVTKRIIMKDFEELPSDLLGQTGIEEEELEVQKMRIIANRRAEASNPRWVEDVRRRKLCCAEGHGIVHGIYYDLKEQFGIELKRIDEDI